MITFCCSDFRPAGGFVFEDHAFEQCFDNPLFFFGETRDGLESKSRITGNNACDALSRVMQRNYSGETGYTTPAVSYFYDNLTNAKGRLTKVSSSVSTTEYTSFDVLGRVTGHKQTTDGQSYSTAYAYNLSGALVEQTYPSGRVVKNTLDAGGSLAQVQSKKNSGDFYRPYASSFAYNAAGAVTAMRLGNGKFETTVFNSRLQPTQIGLGSSVSDHGLLKLDYSYGTTDNNGNVLSQTITVPTVGANTGFVATQNYTYDSLNRLTQATETIIGNQSWKQTFGYDRFGNRNSLAEYEGNTLVNDQTPAIDAANNRFTTACGFTYDLSGNVVTDNLGRTFNYDGENKQKEVKDANNISVGQYYYDGDGKRVKKISNTETVIFVYDASGKTIAEYANEVAAPQDAKVTYLTTDHLGSPRIKTNETGQVISRTDLKPFGEEIYTGSGGRTTSQGYTGADNVRQKFTSYDRDSETDLDFAEARMYNTALGRFASIDPYNIIFEKEIGRNFKEKQKILDSYLILPQLWSKYAYVSNNPLRFVDPTGEIIELTGDERDRQQAFNRLKELVGEKSASKLKIVERDGRYFVEYSGSSNSFAAGGDMASIVGDLIDSSVTNEYRVIYGNSATDANGNSWSLSAQGGAVTIPISSSRTQIFVSYNAVNIANSFDFRDANGNRLKNTSSTIDAHELGHAWGIQRDNVYQQIVDARGSWFEWLSGGLGLSRGPRENVIVESNNRSAVMVENIMRDRLKFPRKVKHQP